MEPEGSLPRSQEPATFSCPKTDQSSPCPPSNYSKIHFNIIFPSTPVSSEWFLPSDFPTKILYAHLLFPIRVTCSAYLLLIRSPEWYLVRSTELKAPCYVVISTPLLPHPSYTQISSSSAPYSRKPSANVPSLMWATKFHTHIKQPAIL